VLDVKAYSNATQAHLWLNGKEQGVTSCAGGVCLWRGIHLAQGANELRATADIGGVETSDTLQWTFAGSPAIVRIKAGDISGYVARGNERYGSDMYFVGGEGKSIDPPDTPVGKRSTVTGAVDPRLCDSYREGEFAYHIPIPDGRRYRITARFVEPTATTSGERVFDVDVNGKRALNAFDVFAVAGGKLKSVERTFDGTAKDGYLVITFRPSRGRALVSSLSIAPLEQH
jgi:beta-galactosidase